MMFNIVKFDPKQGHVVAVPAFMTVVDQGPTHVTLEGSPPDSQSNYSKVADTNRFARITLTIDPVTGEMNRLCKVYKRGVYVDDSRPPRHYFNNKKHATGGKRITRPILVWLAGGMKE